MRHVEGIVPRVTFVESRTRFKVLSLKRIERRIEFSVRQNRTKCSEFLAIIMLVSHRPLVEQIGILFLSHALCQRIQSIIGNVIFQGMRYGVIELFHQRYIAFAHVIVVVRTHQVLFSRKSSRLAHSLIGCFHIKVAQTLHPGIHNHRQTGVTFHRKGFTSVQLPFRQPPMLFVHIDHGTYHVNLTFGIHQGHQLMQVAIGIPQRIYGVTIVFSRFRLSGFHGWVFPVYILEDIRVNQRVIQGSIEHRFLFLCTSFYGDTAQIVVPPFP